MFTKEAEGEILKLRKYNTPLNIQSLVSTEEMVHTKLKSLNKTKSSGPDGILPRVYIELSDIIVVPLTTMFNSSIELEKSVPNDWKFAIVSSIFKKRN